MIHPRQPRRGPRYIVALRDLRGADGALIPPPAAFARYRDRSTATLEPRRAALASGSSATLKRAGIARADLYLAWDFTVASAHSLPSGCCRIRDDAFAQLGDKNLADLKVAAAPRPTVHASTQGHATSRPAAPTAASRREPHLRARRGHGRGAVLPRPARLPGGRRASPRAPDGLPHAAARQRRPAPTSSASSRARSRRPRPGAACRSTATACSARRRGHGAARIQDRRTSRASCCARPTGSACRGDDLPERGHDPRRPVAASRRSPTALQQGMLNFLYLGRAMIHPQGFAADPASRTTASRADRHRPALLRRRQPGRDHRRRADRGRARLHPRGARRAGDELLAAAAALGRLRHRIAQVMYNAYPDELERPLMLR